MTTSVNAAANPLLTLDMPPEEVASPQRAYRLTLLGLGSRVRGNTQSEAATLSGITQNRVSDMVRGKWLKFSTDKFVNLTAWTNFSVRIKRDRTA